MRTELHPLADEEKLAVAVGLESGGKGCGPGDTFDVYHSRGQIAVFGAGDSANDLHTFDIVGRNRAHIHTLVGRVARIVG